MMARCGLPTLVSIATTIGLLSAPTAQAEDEYVALPAPMVAGIMSLEGALATRRSHREVGVEELSLATTGQLLWAAQGITMPGKGLRTAPSAGARFPLRLYVALPSGLYKYEPKGHGLTLRLARDVRRQLWLAVHERPRLNRAPAMFLIAADYTRTVKQYGVRARRFVHMEAGHAGQNLLLQSTALGLHGAGSSDFDAILTRRAVDLPIDEELLYVFAVGKPIAQTY